VLKKADKSKGFITKDKKIKGLMGGIYSMHETAEKFLHNFSRETEGKRIPRVKGIGEWRYSSIFLDIGTSWR
jgi:hypothetical protein